MGGAPSTAPKRLLAALLAARAVVPASSDPVAEALTLTGLYRLWRLTLPSDVTPIFAAWKTFLAHPRVDSFYSPGASQAPGWDDELLEALWPILGALTSTSISDLLELWSAVVEGGGAERASGRYYTPEPLAAVVVDQVLEVLKPDSARPLRMLDPAVGAGVFLVATARAVIRREGLKGLDAAHRWVDLCRTTLAGWDRDPRALLAARWSLRLEAVGVARLAGLTGDALLEWGERADPGAHLWCGDALAGQDGASEQVGPDECGPAPGPFDAILGNPPYLSALRGEKDQFARLKGTSLEARAGGYKGDLFYFFMARGLTLLRPGGVMGWVVPPYWRTRSAATRLRETLTREGDECFRLSFDDRRVFERARGHHSEVTVWRKKSDVPAPVLRAFRLQSSDLTLEEVQSALEPGRTQSGLALEALGDSSGPVAVPQQEVQPARSRVEVGSQAGVWTLSASQICQGVVLPQATVTAEAARALQDPRVRVGDGVFWLRDSELESLEPNLWERALAVPYLPTAALSPLAVGAPVGWLLYLDREASQALRAHPERYPRLVRHLERFREIITSSAGPFGLHRPRSRDWFEGSSRILIARKSRRVRAGRTSEVRFVDQGVNVVRLPGPEQAYFLGVLHSAAAEDWLRQRKSQGDLLQLDKDVLEALPIPMVEQVDEDARRDVDAHFAQGPAAVEAWMGGLPDTARTVFRRVIERAVERLEVRERGQAVPREGWTARPGRGGRIREGTEHERLDGDPWFRCMDMAVRRLFRGVPGQNGWGRVYGKG